MRSKDTISIIAFISAFAVSAAFASLFIDKSRCTNFNTYAVRNSPNCLSKDQTCLQMSSLLVLDNINGAERSKVINYLSGNEKGNVSLKYAETTAGYVEEASNLNDADLPQEFRTKWREHLQAWRDYSEFLNEVSQKKIDNAKFRQLDARHSYEIERTYADVLKIAKTYGINNAYVY